MFPRKYRIHALLVIISLLIIFLPSITEIPSAENATAARITAMAFLDRVDSGDYATSWQMSAQLLKDKVTQQEWSQQLAKIRSICGPLIERKEQEVRFATMAADSPDGEYIELLFETNFEVKKSTTESITVMQEKDKNWRVAGYFIN